MRGILTVLFGLILAVGVAASQPETTLDPASVLQEWSARMQVADSFHAVGRQSETFGMAGMSGATNESLVVIWYQKPNRLFWQDGTTRVVFDGTSVYSYHDGEPTAYRTPAPMLPQAWPYSLIIPMAGPATTAQASDDAEVRRLLALNATAVQSGDEIRVKFSMTYDRLAPVFTAMGLSTPSPWGTEMPSQAAQFLSGMKLTWEIGLRASDYMLRYVRSETAIADFGQITKSELRFSVIARNVPVPAYKFKFRPPEGVEVKEGPRPTPTFGPFPEPQKPPSVSYTDFTLKDVHGLPLSLREYSGKVILLNFWATWCAPCQQEIPELEAFWQTHRNDGDVVLLAISEDEAGTDLRSFVAQQGITFPVLADEQGKVGGLYSVKFYPTTIVFDPSQKHLRTLVGGQTRATLEEVLTQARAAP